MKPCCSISVVWMGISAWCRPSITRGRKNPPSRKPAPAPPVESSQSAKVPMAEETSPATYIRPKIVTRPEISTVSVGVTSTSRASGTQRRHHFSTYTARTAAPRAPRTPPWPGARVWPKASMFATPGKTMIAATAPPRIGVPPNSFAVL